MGVHEQRNILVGILEVEATHLHILSSMEARI